MSDWSSDVCSSDLPTQYGEIVWRFLPEAASRAAEYQFHPNQSAEYRDDGSLIVRFKAAGWLEMAWHLYQWGDKVEVLDPAGLRALVEGHARPDFPALPCLPDLYRPSWPRFSIEPRSGAGPLHLYLIALVRATRNGRCGTGP